MNQLREKVRDFLTPPAHLPRTEQRYYTVMSIAGLLGVFIHFVFIGSFARLQIPILAWYNVASVAMWIGVLILIRRYHRMELGGLLSSFEILAHAALCVLYAGWGFGFQYAIFLLVLIIIITPSRLSIQLLSLAACGGVFIFLASQSEVWNGSPLLPTLVSIPTIFGLLALMDLVMGHYRRIAETAEAALAEAHAQSEGLLLNILPELIAERLKQSDGTIADGFTETSVLFADIADFTPLSQSMTPAEVVQMLDDLFSRFDVLVRKHKLEKIKTIGDAYMVAAGVPIPRTDHAEVMIQLARDIQQAVADYNAEKGMNIRLRIGINSGPVVAGVIGKMRFLYDLWGDSVNTASRMESHGVPGEIQVSEDTMRLLEGKYQFEDRGLIDIKGKGPMRTYFLRESVPAHAN